MQELLKISILINLAVINPKPIFPNDKIIATSVGAKEIIKKSKVYENLEKSLKKQIF